MMRRERVLTITLLLVMVGLIGGVVYLAAHPRPEPFTEFYILGPQGKAFDYPQELRLGERGEVIVSIVNREGQPATYRLLVTLNGQKTDEVPAITLGQAEKWERKVGIAPSRVGPGQKVEFFLYREGSSEAYRSLVLMVDVLPAL